MLCAKRVGLLRLKINIDEENVKRLRLAFYAKRHAEHDANFDEFAETVVNCLISESPLIEFTRKRRKTIEVVRSRLMNVQSTEGISS